MSALGDRIVDGRSLYGHHSTAEEWAELRAELIRLRAEASEAGELRALFEMQWRRSREADQRWRAEDPEARANTWPDLGVLLKWLMDDADRARAGEAAHD